MRSLVAELAALLPPAPESARLRFEDLRIPRRDGPGEIALRVYRPLDAGAALPALVYFHGGAYVAGDLETEHASCAAYCAGVGCVVVSVDYRLAPEHPFPAGLHDCFASTEWVAANAARLAADPSRIAVGGASAGGGLAAATALMARDRGGPALCFQHLVYPTLDDRLRTPSSRFVGSPVIDGGGLSGMWRNYLGSEAREIPAYAAPARAEDLAGLPPAYLLTAEFDPLRDEAIEYAQRLLQAGVPAELHLFAGACHGFDVIGAQTAIGRRASAERLLALQAGFALATGTR